MQLFLITVFLAFLVISASLWLASFRHAPKFHTDRKDFTELLKLVLTGQADYDQWSAVIHIPVRHDAQLEAVRERCLEIEATCYIGKPAQLGKPEAMFSQKGLRLIEEELENLKQDDTMRA